MFLKNSRYYGLETVVVRDRSGREVSAVKLRRLPVTSGTDYTVEARDRLDILAETRHADATRYWRIADANSELEAAQLSRAPGRTVKLPER